MKTLRFSISTLVAMLATFAAGGARLPLLSRVDWFLLATAYQAAAGDFIASTLGGAAGGLIQDVLLLPLKGANAFAKALLGYLLTLISVRVVFAGTLVVAVTLAAASLVNTLVVALLGRLLLGSRFSVGFADIAGGLVTGATGGLLYWAWRFPWREEWLRRQRRRLR